MMKEKSKKELEEIINGDYVKSFIERAKEELLLRDFSKSSNEDLVKFARSEFTKSEYLNLSEKLPIELKDELIKRGFDIHQLNQEHQKQQEAQEIQEDITNLKRDVLKNKNIQSYSKNITGALNTIAIISILFVVIACVVIAAEKSAILILTLYTLPIFGLLSFSLLSFSLSAIIKLISTIESNTRLSALKTGKPKTD